MKKIIALLIIASVGFIPSLAFAQTVKKVVKPSVKKIIKSEVLEDKEVKAKGEKAFDRNFGVGGQFGLMGLGISARYKPLKEMPQLSAQGILSFWSIGGGSSTAFTGRALYSLVSAENFDFYTGGSLGLWMISSGGQSATSIGFGAITGIEYFVAPQFGLNLEAGFMAVSFPGWFAGYSGLVFGLGATYYL
ncbi:MAG: hypothetical protein FD145_663 [Candidatus Saganbacteria bacterium]|uniref:Outer membrane protein beta-barrel domain-containing protein n=1 Tax=Candidatus Saganbacteria bacterium TaxID=2575572 RepID=A0A833L1D2_UNCSA|nr:MAG: hypothetical protein FD145_663 [Candidatus Saganbacteria bacterium]